MSNDLRFSRKPVGLLVATLCCISLTGFAPAHTDFTGVFSSYPQDTKKSDVNETLEVQQSETTLQVTQTVTGTTWTNIYSLDGTSGSYTTITRKTGKACATWHGKDLWIENFVAASMQGRTIRFHSTEKWRLSEDRQTLKIHSETDSPDVPTAVIDVALQPYTKTYKRKN